MTTPLKIFSGNSNPSLVERVCALLQIDPGRSLVSRFSDGEIRIELGESVRGVDVYLMQSICPPVAENLFELLVMMDAIKRSSAWRINVVIPYYGYGRQDQKEKPRVPISAKVAADLLLVAGADRIISVDLHADQIEGFFNIPVDNIYGMQVLLDDVKASQRGDEVVVAPDAGGVARARSFSKKINAGLAILDYRGSDCDQRCSRIVGQVSGRRVIILDDMIDTARTVLRAAEAASSAGADVVDAYCMHAVLSGSAIRRLESSSLRSLTVSDTIPLSEDALRSGKIRSVSVAPLLAEVIRRIHCEGSVSSLFSV